MDLAWINIKGNNMSINSVGRTSSISLSTRTSQTLSEEQKTKLTEILSKYDSSNVSKEDAQSIAEELKGAGIGPGRATSDALKSAGFEMEKMRPEGPPTGGMKGKPPAGAKPPGGKGPEGVGGGKPPERADASSSGSIDAESLQTLKDILDQYDLNNLSDDEQESLFSQLQSAGLIESGMLFDTKA